MSKICFVTYELHPIASGGCGVLLYNSAHFLLRQGHQIVFILDVSTDQFNEFKPEHYPAADSCKAYSVEQLCADIPIRREDFADKNAWRAYRLHWAAQKVTAAEQPDLIEFFDFTGSAHFALSAKVTRLAYQDTQLAVRLHNTYQLTNSHEPPPIPLTIDRYMLFALEHSALRMAEVVLSPSQAFLEEAYQPHYEPWLGQLVHSKPALLHYPKRRDDRQEKKKILFYGRLFGRKGVDIFVDAAVTFLSEGDHGDLTFVLVGFDSKMGPDGSRSYQDYLLKRIPVRFRAQFEFKGQLSWNQVEALLPQILFAVFPTYFESFCYAVHEIYAAGIPVIVNNIPGLRDYFKHRENALLFDGTMSDLAQQMKVLWHDTDLREQISYPYSLADDPLGSYYEGPFSAGWIDVNNGLESQASILICILDDGQHSAAKTIASLSLNGTARIQITILKALTEDAATESGALWFLGRLYHVVDPDGQQIPATDLRTAETLLILRAGDLAKRDYVSTCREVLARQSELSFVASWKRIHRDNRAYVDTFPVDAALELIPFTDAPILSRTVMRTEPGKALADLFDPRLLHMGELGYLWDLEAAHGPGVLIPACLIELNEEDATAWSKTLLTYLILSDTCKYRKIRLTNYLMTLWSTRDHSASPVRQSGFSYKMAVSMDAIRFSKVGQIIRQNPVLAKRIKTMLRMV